MTAASTRRAPARADASDTSVSKGKTSYRRASPARERSTREATPPRYGPVGAHVLVDSGPLLALFNRADRWHGRVVAWLEQHPGIRLVTTWCVLTETCAMLARRVHNDAALDVLRWALRGGITVDGAPQDSLVSLLAISERFADLPFDLADASIAEAAARLRLRRILSIDSDFDVYRDHAGRPLQNLLTSAF